ncbi:cell division cycle-associated protein 3 isoform X2 [Rhinatrema bivittatum]|uniref:cell division cycle-associated protein 3 isoform X2 n=1 Tax=Rhinatrema bivittatum TaxID=194408 RepID=UPI00112DC2B0|nr:cell division cycle-associated protein 3 isoform X2 [Rhinatrema bivittatum]
MRSMGSMDSKPMATPAKPMHHRQLARVLDPRSPTAGILRTPIEVVAPPRNSPAAPGVNKTMLQDSPPMVDPRSPTHGITRTPVKPTEILTSLAMQFNETFVSESVNSLLAKPSLEEKQGAEDQAKTQAEEQCVQRKGEAQLEEAQPKERQAGKGEPVTAAEEAASPRMKAILTEGRRLDEKPRRSSNSGWSARQRSRPTGGKELMTLAGNGRLPLQALRDENSPTTICHRQVKYPLLVSDGLTEQLPGRGKAWEHQHDKENTELYS